MIDGAYPCTFLFSDEIEERLKALVNLPKLPGVEHDVPTLYGYICMAIANCSANYIDEYQTDDQNEIIEDAGRMIESLIPIFERPTLN